MRFGTRITAIIVSLVMFAGATSARTVQISAIDFSQGTIELTNFGSTSADMSNWRFFSHDDDQVRVYSSAPGIGGLINPGETITFDISTDNFALPFDNDAYSLSIFDTGAGGFGGTDNMLDHLQWSTDGVDAPGAAFRTGQAVTAGIWTAVDEFIPTTADTTRIELTDLTGGILHGAGNYVAVPEPSGIAMVLAVFGFAVGRTRRRLL